MKLEHIVDFSEFIELVVATVKIWLWSTLVELVDGFSKCTQDIGSFAY